MNSNLIQEPELPELIPVVSDEDWRAYHDIRRDVLWTARGRSGYDDQHADEFLPNHHPLLLKLAGKGIGTTRLDDRQDGTGIVRLVAILAQVQHIGHGRTLDWLLVQLAGQLGIERLLVNAAPDAVGFYEKCGWTEGVWDLTELTGISADCVQMQKLVRPS